MIYLAPIQRALCQGPTILTPRSSPPTGSCHPSCDQRASPGRVSASSDSHIPGYAGWLALVGRQPQFLWERAGRKLPRWDFIPPSPPPPLGAAQGLEHPSSAPSALIPSPMVPTTDCICNLSSTFPHTSSFHCRLGCPLWSAWVGDGKGTRKGDQERGSRDSYEAVLVPEGAGKNCCCAGEDGGE